MVFGTDVDCVTLLIMHSSGLLIGANCGRVMLIQRHFSDLASRVGKQPCSENGSACSHFRSLNVSLHWSARQWFPKPSVRMEQCFRQNSKIWPNSKGTMSSNPAPSAIICRANILQSQINPLKSPATARFDAPTC